MTKEQLIRFVRAFDLSKTLIQDLPEILDALEVCYGCSQVNAEDIIKAIFVASHNKKGVPTPRPVLVVNNDAGV